MYSAPFGSWNGPPGHRAAVASESGRPVDHAEPGTDLPGMRGRLGDGVVDPLDTPIPDGKSKALQIGNATGGEGGEPQRPLQGEALVADQLERQAQALYQLALVDNRLGGKAIDRGPDLAEARVQVAEALRLRRGAVGAGDVVPTGRIGQARRAGPGVAVDDGHAGRPREAHAATGRGRQVEIGHALAAPQVARAAVIG